MKVHPVEHSDWRSLSGDGQSVPYVALSCVWTLRTRSTSDTSFAAICRQDRLTIEHAHCSSGSHHRHRRSPPDRLRGSHCATRRGRARDDCDYAGRRHRPHRLGSAGVLASLDDAGRAKVQFPFDGPQKTRWSNLPSGIFQRQGLRHGRSHAGAARRGDDAADDRAQSRRLPQGDRDHARRRSAEDRGRRPERRWRPGGGAQPGGGGRGGPSFGEDEYYLAFLGTPSTTAPWMLQFGGHHLAINLTMAGSQASMTPSLPAAQPATYTFEGREIRPLGQEKDKSLALINALDATQRSQAILNYRVADLVLGPGQDGRVIQPEGIRASALSPAQQTMLLEIVREWAGIMNDAFAEPRMAEIRANLRGDVLCVERPDDRRQRRLLPHPGADTGHRIRAAGQRRPHSHDLSRSDQRLRCEVHGEAEAVKLRLKPPADAPRSVRRILRRLPTMSRRSVAAVALTLIVSASPGPSAHRRDEYSPGGPHRARSRSACKSSWI